MTETEAQDSISHNTVYIEKAVIQTNLSAELQFVIRSDLNTPLGTNKFEKHFLIHEHAGRMIVGYLIMRADEFVCSPFTRFCDN